MEMKNKPKGIEKGKPIHDFMKLTYPINDKNRLIEVIVKCMEKIGKSLILRDKVARPKKDKDHKINAENMSSITWTLNKSYLILDELKKELWSPQTLEESKEEETEEPLKNDELCYPAILLVVSAMLNIASAIYRELKTIKAKYYNNPIYAMWIMSNRMNKVLDILPNARVASPNEIYFQDQEARSWKDLRPHFEVFFDFSDKLAKSYRKFNNRLINWAASCSQGLFSDSASLSSKLTKTIGGMFYYKMYKIKGQYQAEKFFVNPTPNETKRFWGTLTENKIMGKVGNMTKKQVKTFREIYLPKLLPTLTEKMLDEKSMYLVEGLPLNPPDTFIQYGVDPNQYNPYTNIKVQIIWKNELMLEKESQLLVNKDKLDPESVLVYIHGGGWVSGNGKSSFLRKWTEATNILIFAIEYRLSPKSQFPEALDDCWQAYYWIVTQAYQQFGVNSKVLLLTGDSTGGNLAAGVCLRAIHCGFRKPTGIILGYPLLICSEKMFRPSLLLSLEDSLMRPSLLTSCYRNYMGESTLDPLISPYLSPLFMSDEDLAQFPPTRILACGRDPLRDESYSLLARMVREKVDVFLKELRMYPHRVWELSSWIQNFPQCDIGNYIVISWIQQLTEKALLPLGSIPPSEGLGGIIQGMQGGIRNHQHLLDVQDIVDGEEYKEQQTKLLIRPSISSEEEPDLPHDGDSEDMWQEIKQPPAL